MSNATASAGADSSSGIAALRGGASSGTSPALRGGVSDGTPPALRGGAAMCAWATPLVLAVAAVVWPLRLAAGPHLYDAGELVSAAWTLGASHPPGQPLHALFAHVAAWLPLGPIAARIALFSAACALAAAFFSACLCRELALELGALPRDANLASAATALGVLLASPVLRQALRVEVYGLAMALTMLALLDVSRWARGGSVRYIWRAAFVAGLDGCVHPPHALAVALATLGFVLAQPALLQRKPALVIVGGVGLGLLGLCAYAYLPARAAAGAMVWGDPLSARGFWEYVSGKAYVARGPSAGNSLLSLPLGYLGYLFEQGAVVWWLGALAALGLVPLPMRRVLLGALLASGLVIVAPCLRQPIEARNPDNVAYLGPCIGLAISTGAAACALLRSTRVRWLGGLGLLLIAFSPASLVRAITPLNSDLPALETLAGSLLEAPPPRALVIATSDYTAAAWMMQQAVDGARPDAALFISGLSTSSWQWAQMAHHPALHGRPVRGPGRDPHEKYLLGAIGRGLPHVVVALERDLEGLPISALSGAYALLDARAATTPPAPQRASIDGTAPALRGGAAFDGTAPALRGGASIGERLDPVVAAAAARSPDGDSGAGAAIVRDYQRQRALRLIGLGEGSRALRVLESSLWPLPVAERALLRVPNLARPSARAPHWVEDPSAFLASLEDMVRMSAAVLQSFGQPDAARGLLRAQAERGDPRALLQLAWLQFAAGDREAAQHTLADFSRAAPALQAEGRDLADLLAR